MSAHELPNIVLGDFFKSYHKNVKCHSVSLFLSDPPYGIFKAHRNKTKVLDPEINLNRLEYALDYIMSENSAVLLFCNLNLLMKLISSFKQFVFKWNYVICKSLAVPAGKYRPIPTVEYIAVFHRVDSKTSEIAFKGYESGRIDAPYLKRNYVRHQKTRKKIKPNIDVNESGKRWIRQNLKMKNRCNLTRKERDAGKGHPFQKSERLLRSLIRVHSNVGDLVCDGFAGSGSTLVSAYKENRKSIGFEIENKWYRATRYRIVNETKQRKLFQC